MRHDRNAKLMVRLAGTQQLDIRWLRRCIGDKKLRYGGMEPSLSENQTQHLPVSSNDNMSVNEPVNMLTDTKKVEAKVEKIRTMLLGESQP